MACLFKEQAKFATNAHKFQLLPEKVFQFKMIVYLVETILSLQPSSENCKKKKDKILYQRGPKKSVETSL